MDQTYFAYDQNQDTDIQVFVIRETIDRWSQDQDDKVYLHHPEMLWDRSKSDDHREI